MLRRSRVAAFFSFIIAFARAFRRSLVRKKWERKKLRDICLNSSERKTRKCAMKEKRGSPSSSIIVARYDGAFCVLSSAYCGLGRRFMHHARRKTTKETYFGCLTDHKKNSLFNITAKWKKKRTRRLKRKRRKMRMRSK